MMVVTLNADGPTEMDVFCIETETPPYLFYSSFPKKNAFNLTTELFKLTPQYGNPVWLY